MAMNRMLYYIIAIILFLLIIALVFLNCEKEGFQSNDIKLEYYSLSTCPHCVKFNPLWETIQGQCKGCAVKYVVDESSEGKQLAQRYNISSFPTIIVTENGEKKDELVDGRTCESIKRLCKKNGVPCTLTC